MDDDNCWCPCRISRAGEGLIESVIKNFGGRTDFVQSARQEIMKIYQHKESPSHSGKENCCKIGKKSQKKAKSQATDENFSKPSEKYVSLRGKRLLRPRALPTRM